MSRNIKLMKRVRATALVFGAAALWILLPFYFQFDSAMSSANENPSNLPDLIANLSGSPIGNMAPRGSAVYDTFTQNNTTVRTLSVSVTSVNLPANTHLGAFLNDTNIGEIIINSQKRGELRLSTINNGSVPTVVSGDDLVIKNGATVVLSGEFSAPATPSPFPSPSGSPSHTPFPSPSVSPTGTPGMQSHFYASLTGEPIGDVMPRGFASYESRTNQTALEVFVNFVNLPNGTTLSVTVGDTSAGTFTLNSQRGRLGINTNVPTVANGTAITVKNGATTILSGTFTNSFPTPNPSPSVSPTVHPSPTTTPTPRPARAFFSRLGGASVVPAVETTGRGQGFVRLNQDETEITVNLRYFRLSSAATTITINGPALSGENADEVFTLENDGGTTGHIEPQTFDVTAEQVQQLRAGLWYFSVATADHAAGEIRGQIRSNNCRDDYQGDGFTDVAVLRSGNNAWYILNTRDFSYSARTFGQAGDINVQGDYDGDGIVDLAMFTPSTGNWKISRSELGTIANYRFGQNGDVPVVGDYDGDGRNDLAVFRPSTGAWYIQNSFDGTISALTWGMNGDRPVSGDFDGDGLNDIAVFRQSNGGWYVFQSGTRSMLAMQFGQNGDRPISGDFDGDGATDIAVFRPSNGAWYITQSSDNAFRATIFGMSTDVTVAADYDGDGIGDIAVYRPSNGYWYILRSSDNALGAYQFGISSDRPSQVAYTP